MIKSDASNGGWGACCNGLRTRGQWSRQEAPLHINGKELLATFLAVKPFAKNKRVWHIRLDVDNMTAVYYINHMGEPGVNLMKITTHAALELVPAERHCALRTFTGSVGCGSRSGVTGKRGQFRLEAESNSFTESDVTVGSMSGGPIWFTSQCPVGVLHELETRMRSWFNSNRCSQSAMDKSEGVCLPPFSLIGMCLSKMRCEKVPELILIAPVWPTQPWYPVLKETSFREVILLPPLSNLLQNVWEEPHPLLVKGSLTLAAWTVSGLTSRTREFQSRHQPSSLLHGGKILKLHTPVAGRDGNSGVHSMDSNLCTSECNHRDSFK